MIRSSDYRSRKFLLTVCTMLYSSLLLVLDHITAENFVSLNQITLAAYMASNAWIRVGGKKEDER